MRTLRKGEPVYAEQLPIIEVKTWAEAEAKGWSVTTDIEWSPDGKPVFLCPKCSGESKDSDIVDTRKRQCTH